MQSDFRENLQLALDTVRAHKLRSFLAILGVMIGVALIILVVGLVQGFRQTIQDEIVSEGIDTAFVSRFDQGPQNGRRPKDEKLRKPLTLADAMAIRQLCPAVKEIAVSAFQWQLAHTARYQANEVQRDRFSRHFSGISRRLFQRHHESGAVLHRSRKRTSRKCGGHRRKRGQGFFPQH